MGASSRDDSLQTDGQARSLQRVDSWIIGWRMDRGVTIGHGIHWSKEGPTRLLDGGGEGSKLAENDLRLAPKGLLEISNPSSLPGFLWKS